MRGTAILALAGLLLAGCSGPQEPADDQPIVNATPCPTYPDGTAIDCNARDVAPTPIPTGRPSLMDGWTCLTHYQDNAEPERGYMELFRHQDGRVGYHWNLAKPRDGGVNIVEGVLFFSDSAMSVVADYQPSGFLVFPEKPPESTGSGNLLIRNFRIDVRLDGNWTTPDASQLSVGRFEGHAWYVWNYTIGDRQGHLSMMEKRPDEDTGRIYTPVKRFNETADGFAVYSDASTFGVKYTSLNFQPDPLRAYGCQGVLP